MLMGCGQSRLLSLPALTRVKRLSSDHNVFHGCHANTPLLCQLRRQSATSTICAGMNRKILRLPGRNAMSGNRQLGKKALFERKVSGRLEQPHLLFRRSRWRSSFRWCFSFGRCAGEAVWSLNTDGRL
jgi:hypothetical protein